MTRTLKIKKKGEEMSYKNLIILLVFLMLVLNTTSCINSENIEKESILTVTTTKEIPTATKNVIPTTTPTPKPTTPHFRNTIDAGLIEKPSDGVFFDLANDNEGFGVKSSNEKNVYYSMYASHEWNQFGLEITTPKGNTVRITKSETTKEYLSFSIFINEKLTQTIYTINGVLIDFRTDLRESADKPINWDNFYSWGTYDPKGNQFVTCAKFVKQENGAFLCKLPHSVVYLLINPEWNVTLNPGMFVRDRGVYVPFWCNSYALSVNKLESEIKPYQLPDGSFYQFGPPPLVCPELYIVNH